jgi:hypothetical protein
MTSDQQYAAVMALCALGGQIVAVLARRRRRRQTRPKIG